MKYRSLYLKQACLQQERAAGSEPQELCSGLQTAGSAPRVLCSEPQELCSGLQTAGSEPQVSGSEPQVLCSEILLSYV